LLSVVLILIIGLMSKMTARFRN